MMIIVLSTLLKTLSHGIYYYDYNIYNFYVLILILSI